MRKELVLCFIIVLLFRFFLKNPAIIQENPSFFNIYDIIINISAKDVFLCLLMI